MFRQHRLAQLFVVFFFGFSIYAFTAQSQQTSLLEPDNPIEAELPGGQTQTFQAAMQITDFARVTVSAKNTDLSIKLIAPNGNTVAEYQWAQDSPDPINLSWIAGQIGNFRVELISREKESKPFSIKLAERRAFEPQDPNRIEAERQFASGEIFRVKEANQDRRPALAHYQQALKLYRALGERQKEAMTMNALGRIHDNLGERDKAFEYFTQLLPMRRELKDRGGEAGTLGNLAGIHSGRGERQKALELYQESLVIRRELKDQRGEAITLHSLGDVYLGLNQRDKAVQHYEQSLSIRREIKDRRGEALSLSQLGVLSRQMGKNDQALQYYNQALAVFQELNDRRNEAGVLRNLAILFLQQSKRQEGLVYLEKAYQTFHELGAKQNESSTLQNIGTVYDELGEHQKAIEYFTRAEQLQREINFMPGLGLTLYSFGALYEGLGERKRALEYYNQARPIFLRSGGPGQEAVAITSIGQIYAAQGDRQTALDYYLQSLSALKDAQFLDRQGNVLNDIGSLYLALNEKQLAIDYFNQALEIRRKTNNRFGQATTLSNLGIAYHGLDDKEKALELFGQSLELAKQDRRATAYTLNAAAPVYNDLGDSQKALDTLKQALELLRQIKDRSGEANALHNIGGTHLGLKQLGEARANLSESLRLYTNLENRNGESISRFGLAKVEFDSGNLPEARTQIETALDLVESLRANVTSQELRASYFASVQKFYDLYIEILMRQHDQQKGSDLNAAALNVSERARARGLLELLTESNANIRQGVDAKLIERERDLRQLLNAKADRQIQLRIANASEDKLNEVAKELQTLGAEFEQVQARIRSSSPRYAALTQPQTLSLKEIQGLLDADTMLLEYFLGEDASFLWAITPTAMQSYKLPKRADINKAARQVYELLIARNRSEANETNAQQRRRVAQADAEFAAASRNLSRMILSPVAQQLGQKRLVIVAQGALQYVPFGSLPVIGGRLPVIGKKAVGKKAVGNKTTPQSAIRNPQSDRPLILDHEIINLPSDSTLAVLRRETEGRKPAEKMLAVFADPVFDAEDERLAKVTIKAAKPDNTKKPPASSEQTRRLKHINEQFGAARIPRLPFTRQEAEQILSLVPESDRKSALDFNANRASVTAADVSQYRMIHFATHGLLNSQQPELSSIVLSLVDEKGQPQEGFLRSHEIYNLNLPAEVVVLSACETGLGKEIKGEGLVGLTRGFMYAGSPRVVVSLWSVNDRATADLMARFYRKMLKDNLRPAAALRAAQIEMLNGQWSQPYFWAAFALQGEWR